MADVTITTTAIKKIAGNTITDRGVSGAAITVGDVLYRDSSDSNKLKRAIATTQAQALNVVGIALNSVAGADQPVEYAISGDLTMSGLTAGTVYVLSGGAAGGIAPTADLDTGTTWYATLLGVASSTTNLKLAIKASNAINA
jgi:hypothetical protein